MLGDAPERNFEKWPLIGIDLPPNHYTPETYDDEINYIKTWIGQRAEWIDKNIVLL